MVAQPCLAGSPGTSGRLPSRWLRKGHRLVVQHTKDPRVLGGLMEPLSLALVYVTAERDWPCLACGFGLCHWL